MATFSKARYQARLFGLCWAILEKRDKEFDAEKLKKQDWIVIVLHALDYATDAEKEVITQLPDIIKVKHDIADDRAAMIGAIEGKNIVYFNRDPHELYLDRDLIQAKKESSGSDISNFSRKKLIIWGCIVAFFLGLIIYNLPICQEYREYRAVVKSKTVYSCDSYFQQYGMNARHSDDVMYTKIVATNYDVPTMALFLSSYPKNEHIAEVKKIYDSAWDNEIAKYENSDKSKYSEDAEKFMKAMLDYLHKHYCNEIVVDVDMKLNLKEYDEYPDYAREYIERCYFKEGLLVSEGMVSLKRNFTTSNQQELMKILIDGVQKSMDRIFTPNFIRVTTTSPKTKKLPQLCFRCNVQSKEVFDGIPAVYGYYETNENGNNERILAYLMGISIDFSASFSIPNNKITYSYSEIGEPEKSIQGIIDIKDGYLRMSAMCFAQFSNKMSRNLGLQEVYFNED